MWMRHTGNNNAKRYTNVADIILYYVKGTGETWNQQYVPLSKEKLDEYNRSDPDGRLWTTADLTAPNSKKMFEWRGTIPTTRGWAYSFDDLEKMYDAGRIIANAEGKPLKRGRKMYIDESKGVRLKNIWTDIKRIGNSSLERLNYPTQKPLKLLQRIIKASSNRDDIVLDPFCGCGTTIEAAKKLGRRWIGFDQSVEAIVVCEKRLNTTHLKGTNGVH